MAKIRAAQIDQMKQQLIKGALPTEIAEEIEKVTEISSELARAEGHQLAPCFSAHDPALPSGKLSVELKLQCNYGDDHPLKTMVKWHSTGEPAASSARAALAIEGCSELIAWGRTSNRGACDSVKEADVIRITSCFGHRDVFETFLQSSEPPCSSSPNALAHAALLGAAEAGRAADTAPLFAECESFVFPPDSFVGQLQKAPLAAKSSWWSWAGGGSKLKQ